MIEEISAERDNASNRVRELELQLRRAGVIPRDVPDPPDDRE